MTDLTFHKLDDQEFNDLYDSIIDTLKKDELNSASEIHYNKYDLANYPKEKLLREIIDNTTAFFVAKVEENNVGFLKINCKGLESTVKENNVLEIELLYILPAYRKMGFGQLFFDKALELSKQCDAKHLWVSVRETNAKAIKFYHHFGMRKFATRMKSFQEVNYNDLLLKIKTNRK